MVKEVEHVVPINILDVESSLWTKDHNFFFSLAFTLAMVMPRGKGFFPRWLGRLFGKNSHFTVKTAGGALMAVDPDNWDLYARLLLRGGIWETTVIEACIACLRPGDVFYDIGANIGYMSIETARFFKDAIRIYAFEPQPNLARIVGLSAKLNHFQKLATYDIMLGKKEGVSNLFVPSHSIHASSIDRKLNSRSIACQVKTLDNLVARGNILPPDVIKIDVEGGELDVFHGMGHIIQSASPYIIFEVDDNMDRFGYNREDLFDFILNLTDYQFLHIMDREFSPIHRDERRQGNVLAVPKGKPIPQRSDFTVKNISR
jgi:FkbM family methyltransferase